jgi:hypothetical protein
LSIGEFITYKTAVDQAVANLVKIEFPEVSAYVNASTGEYVDSPSLAQLKQSMLVKPRKNFLIKNRKVSYDGKITNELLTARELHGYPSEKHRIGVNNKHIRAGEK